MIPIATAPARTVTTIKLSLVFMIGLLHLHKNVAATAKHTDLILADFIAGFPEKIGYGTHFQISVFSASKWQESRVSPKSECETLAVRRRWLIPELAAFAP